MKIKQTNICEHCNMNSIDTIEFFFYDCGKIKVLWKAIEREINLTITEHLAIFGVPRTLFNDEETFKFANLLILIAKRCISLHKYSQKINIITLFKSEKLWRNM